MNRKITKSEQNPNVILSEKDQNKMKQMNDNK